MMDWTKPGKAIIVTVCAIIFVIIVHFCCFLLYRARVWLFTKLCIRGARRYDADMSEGLQEDSSSRCLGGTGSTLSCAGGSSYDYSHQQQYPIPQSNQPRRTQHLIPTSQQHQHQPHQHQTVEQLHNTAYHQPQYAAYQQQPVVAGVNVGVVSSSGIRYHTQSNKDMLKSRHVHASSTTTPTNTTTPTTTIQNRSSGASQLETAQRSSEFLNPNKIMEYKM